MGGQCDRDEAPGPDRRSAADPRSLRKRPREPRGEGGAGRDLEPGRGDVSRPAPPGARRDDLRDRLAALGRARAGGPDRWPDLRQRGRPRAGGSRRRQRDRHGRGDRRDRPAGSPLESTGEKVVDPRLDVFRDFVNSLDVDPETGEGRQRAPAAPAARADERSRRVVRRRSQSRLRRGRGDRDGRLRPARASRTRRRARRSSLVWPRTPT